MNYQELIKKAKLAIIATDPEITEDELENFWMATLMELQRIMFRMKDKDVLYLVEINTMTEMSTVKKYIPA